MVSLSKLSEVLEKISDDYDIKIDLSNLESSFPELKNLNLNKKNAEIESITRCLALLSKGERCTRKPKCMKNGLCGIHLNMLQKNGSLPNGRFNNNNGAEGQSSTASVSNLKNESEKLNKSSKLVGKAKKSGKEKIDKDVETDDSDDDNNTQNSNIDMIKQKIDEVVKETINESNYDQCKNFVKKIESLLSDNIDSNLLEDKNLIKQLIKTRLDNEFEYYDLKIKKDIEEYQDESSCEEEIECVKIEKDNKFYLLDEKSSIVYNINEPHSEIGILKNDVIVHLD